jgi:hypothetical protein
MVEFCDKYVLEDVYILLEGLGRSSARKHKCVHSTILLVLSRNEVTIFSTD